MAPVQWAQISSLYCTKAQLSPGCLTDMEALTLKIKSSPQLPLQVAIRQIPDKAELVQPVHIPQQESPDCVTSWNPNAGIRHRTKENLSFPLQCLLISTLECPTEGRPFP